MGDLLRVFPMLVSLRKEGLRASLLTSYPGYRDLLGLLHPSFHPEKVIFWNLKSRPRLFEKIRLLRRIRRERFDFLFDTSRGTGWRGNYRLGKLSGARVRVGFLWEDLGADYEIRVPFSLRNSILDQNLSLLRAAGFRAGASFGLNLPSPAGPPFDVVCHGGAVDPGRNAPSSFWRTLTSLLREEGLRVAAVGGAEESILWEGCPAENLCGRLSLTELASLLAGALLFVGVDSGPLHLALALGTPAVGLFGPTDPEQVVGKRPGFEALTAEYACAPCYRHLPDEKVRCPEPPCLEKLSPERALALCRRLLR